MIEFYDGEKNKSFVSIYKSHITFNKNLIKYLSEAYRTRVGIDRNYRKIYIFPLNKDQALSGEFNVDSLFAVSLSKTYARICSKSLLEYICENFELKIENDDYLRYNAKYDDVKRAIVVDLKEEVK